MNTIFEEQSYILSSILNVGLKIDTWNTYKIQNGVIVFN